MPFDEQGNFTPEPGSPAALKAGITNKLRKLPRVDTQGHPIARDQVANVTTEMLALEVQS